MGRTTKSRARAKPPSAAIAEPAEPEPSRRRHRPRPTPSWLLEQQDLDEIARRRCLMVLSVLSGETPVTEAITSANISRQLYYQMEERALRAMLKAVTPGAETAPSSSAVESAAARKIVELESKVARLEQERRRSERLLLLTRKVIKPGPLTTGARGRPAKARLSSTKVGHVRSPSSPKVMKPTAPVTSIASAPAADGTAVSIPSGDGEDGR